MTYVHRALVARTLTAAFCAVVGAASIAAHAADFVKPTAEELAMTSLPGYPGAPAVLLFREEITRDDIHSVQHYERVKVLTEEGKKYANVELPYVSSSSWSGSGDDKVLEDIVGRTIHPDGTVIPFTSKPYLKVLEKKNGYKVQEKVFTLPDVEVGSIIEYRYFTRINDHVFESPIWMVQDDLYVKEAHFVWYPTSKQLIDEDGKEINSISWFPILPPGAKIENRELPTSTLNNAPTRIYELHVKDVPPRVEEEYMPPTASFSYRVNFSFTPYHTQQEYWSNKGKQWSKHVNSFAGPNGALKNETAKVIAGAATPEEKLQKIYGAVMDVENTHYTREHDEREDKAAGLGEVKDAADVLTHHRGTPGQITQLFVGMARAAGFNAYVMWVPDRTQDIFTPMWLDTRQLDDYIAIVNVNGQDRFFDPGSRFCGYGQLAWQHTLVSGIRQTDGGTAVGQTPIESYKANHMSRVANLKMDEAGEVTGSVGLSFTGAPAVHWRQVALRGDLEGLRKDLRETAEKMLPKGLDIEITNIGNVAGYDKPFTVEYSVKGTMGNSVGKRLMLPADVFLGNEAASFPHEHRELAVYFHYPEFTQDAVRISFPKNMSIEAVPSSTKYNMAQLGAYALRVDQTPESVTTRRDFAFGDVLVLPPQYKDLRTFYSQLESKDQESVVLKAAPASASAAPPKVAQPAATQASN